MDLPNFRRGFELSSLELNKLSNAIRSAAVTSVIGGTFSRTPGGTTITVTPQVRGGSGTDVACQYFKCTDASEGSVLKVEVAQNLIANRWPDGMGLGFPAYKLELGGNSYIYAKVLYDTTTLQIPTDSTAITILQSDVLLPNTASEVYLLLATVLTAGSPKKITQINNVCSQPVPNPCTLAWTE